MRLPNIFKKELNEDQKAIRFWKWFDNNQNNFLFLSEVSTPEKDKLMNEFLTELHKFNEDVYFEIGGHKDDEKVELIISAEGILEQFPAVEKLTNHAPKYKNWKIIAFKPPMRKGFSLEYRGKIFDPEKTIYIPSNSKKNPNAIGFNVCYPDFEESEKEIFINGTYLILDSIIGEKSVAMDIDYMEVIVTPENISDFDFGHLSDIGEYIEKKKNLQNNARTEKRFIEWIENITKTEEINKSIIGFNFGIFESIDGFKMYLIGSNFFNIENDDWATSNDFEPIQKYFHLGQEFSTNKDWLDVLEFSKKIIHEYVNSNKFENSILKNAHGITTGFDDGNLEVIYIKSVSNKNY